VRGTREGAPLGRRSPSWLEPKAGRWGVAGKLFGVLFTGVFAAAGSFVAYFGVVRPVHDVYQRDWQPTTCTMLSSKVTEHSDSDGTTYGIDVLYEYRAAGSMQRGSRYDLGPQVSTGNHSAHYDIVSRYPPGARVACWFDPAEPEVSVIQRELPTLVWEAGLFSLPFLLVGYVGMGYVLFGRSGTKSAETTPAARVAGGFVALEPEDTVLGTAIGITLVAVFWNAITGLFVFEAIKSFASGDGSWFLALFMIPFVAVGAFLLFAAVRGWLQTFVARPLLEIQERSLHPGESVQLRCRLAGGGMVGPPTVLTISLRGREQATYRRGTDTHTDKEIFFSESLHRASPTSRDQTWTCTARIPRGVMHSWSAAHNAVIWTLHVTLEQPLLPDTETSFAIEVLPARGGSSS
jgi:hypothetical protein